MDEEYEYLADQMAQRASESVFAVPDPGPDPDDVFERWLESQDEWLLALRNSRK